MSKEEKRLIQLRLPPNIVEKIEALQGIIGLPTLTATITYAISFSHDKWVTKQLYLEKQSARVPRDQSDSTASPEDRALARATARKQTAEAEATNEKAEQTKKCALLGGIIDPAQANTCFYNMYTRQSPTLCTYSTMGIPLNQINEYIIANQYRSGGSRDPISKADFWDVARVHGVSVFSTRGIGGGIPKPIPPNTDPADVQITIPQPKEV